MAGGESSGNALANDWRRRRWLIQVSRARMSELGACVIRPAIGPLFVDCPRYTIHRIERIIVSNLESDSRSFRETRVFWNLPHVTPTTGTGMK